MEYQQSARTIIPLLVVTFLLIGYNFMQAQWTGPADEAPLANTDTPLNVGSLTQAKTGNLVANIFAATTQMRSNQYCDALGNNCFSATAVTEDPGSMEFGGMYLRGPNAQCGQVGFTCSLVCSSVNPSTGGCSCPTGFSPRTISYSSATCSKSGDSDTVCTGPKIASQMAICIK